MKDMFGEYDNYDIPDQRTDNSPETIRDREEAMRKLKEYSDQLSKK